MLVYLRDMLYICDMIDIRTLIIGSHVEYEGKRERIRGLDEDNGLIVRFPAEYVSVDKVKPIPITPELLTGLGFEDCTKCFYEEWEKRWDNKKHMYFPLSVTTVGECIIWMTVWTWGIASVVISTKRKAFLSLHNIDLIDD